MSKLKAGDDAVIIKSIVNLNVGKFVKVIRVVGDLRQMDEYDIGDGCVREAVVDGVHWLVQPKNWLINANGYQTGEAVYPAAWLQPLRGDSTDDEKSVDKIFETVL